jgi:ATP phosphoribosyltransferase regulatory subunit
MGLEFLGGGGPPADIEVIAIAIECLEAVGVSNFVLAIGHAGVVTALLDECDLGPDDPRREAALESLNRRDPIALATALQGASGREAARKALVGLAQDNGIRQSIGEARKALGETPRAVKALDDLESVTNTLEEAGLRGRVAIDLSESRALDYYTGLVFRVYGGDLGFDVGGGGRYDALLGRLGRPMPAIGFMLGLDRLALLVERQAGWTAENIAPLAPVAAASLGESLREARERRARGERIHFGGPA